MVHIFLRLRAALISRGQIVPDAMLIGKGKRRNLSFINRLRQRLFKSQYPSVGRSIRLSDLLRT